ncbi:unnamed protein product [Spirodela intermedia]|nr:unnamed protein product [Spirodela intermedia]CAA6670172.1 unnamed protein product [Spirodela intermedia]
MSPWSRGSSWGQPYPARAGGSYPFSRAAATFGGAFGRRLPIKTGARSLQWKRESPSPATDGKHLQNSPLPGSGGGGGGLLSPTARSLTYVRSKPKPDEAAA